MIINQQIGQMGVRWEAELTEHPFRSTWWGLCFKDGRSRGRADLFQSEGRVAGQ